MPRSPTRRDFCKGLAIGASTMAVSGIPGCELVPCLPDGSPRLADCWERRRDSYDFIVIGSGYGGAIMAARICAAMPDSKVCLLERGREWPVGTFPDTNDAANRAIRVPGLNPLGLYEFRASGNIGVLQGCGLGGTSLINGNVALVPDAEVFEREPWPAAITLDALRPFFQRAGEVLLPRPHPRAESFLKFQALNHRAAQIAGRPEAVDLTVNFDLDGLNKFGLRQRPCIDCGDCFTGCNVGAKNTVAMNYLPFARANGAQLFTCAEVDWVEKQSDAGWRIHGRRYTLFGAAEAFSLRAANVILAAGAIGSTEILLRSQAHGLPLAGALGQGFSGNGDFFGFAHNSDHQTNVLGFGNRPRHHWRRNAPGPAVIGAVRYHGDRPLTEQFIIEELSIPRALIGPMMATLGLLSGEDTDEGDELAEFARRVLDRADRPYVDHNALNHTMAYLVVGHDTANGRIVLNPSGNAEIDWNPTSGRTVALEAINAELHEHARALGARFISNPPWTLSDRRLLITAHPLGGCPMGDSHDSGAVDGFGRAYGADGSTHTGLYVADGSVIPTALGVNPFLTIAAVCERIAAHLVGDTTP